jgi:hypothetical protein
VLKGGSRDAKPDMAPAAATAAKYVEITAGKAPAFQDVGPD